MRAGESGLAWLSPLEGVVGRRQAVCGQQAVLGFQEPLSMRMDVGSDVCMHGIWAAFDPFS